MMGQTYSRREWQGMNGRCHRNQTHRDIHSNRQDGLIFSYAVASMTGDRCCLALYSVSTEYCFWVRRFGAISLLATQHIVPIWYKILEITVQEFCSFFFFSCCASGIYNVKNDIKESNDEDHYTSTVQVASMLHIFFHSPTVFLLSIKVLFTMIQQSGTVQQQQYLSNSVYLGIQRDALVSCIAGGGGVVVIRVMPFSVVVLLYCCIVCQLTVCVRGHTAVVLLGERGTGGIILSVCWTQILPFPLM